MTAAAENWVKVCAVVVTFNPDPSTLGKLLDSVLLQSDKVVLVDNGSTDASTVSMERPGVDVLLLGENLGLAAAQNRGIQRATEFGCSHVLLLDQDSILAPDMVARLLAAEARYTLQGVRVGVVGPRFVDSDTGAETWFHGRGPLRYRYLKGTESDPVVRADLLIASGMLIRCGVLDAVGGMDETLFIDLVDTEWCLRAASAGYVILGASDAMMYHSIGSGSVKSPGGKGRRGTFPIHPPLRYYYMFRNSLILTLKAGIPGWWKLNNAMELLFLLVCVSFMPAARLTVLMMMARGVADGLLARQGQYLRGKTCHMIR